MTKQGPTNNLPSKEWLTEIARRLAPLKTLRDLHVHSEDLTRPEVGAYIRAEDRAKTNKKGYGSLDLKIASFVHPEYVEPIRAAISLAPGLVDDLLAVYLEYERLSQAHNALEGLVRRAIRVEGVEESEFKPLSLTREGPLWQRR